MKALKLGIFCAVLVGIAAMLIRGARSNDRLRAEIAALLRSLPQQNSPQMADYLKHLLAAFPAEAIGPASPPKPSGLIEPLSERELEVLGLMSEGLTNPDIAKRLIISLSTVKTHLNNIYGKLSVRNRAEAVLRAKELGLL